MSEALSSTTALSASADLHLKMSKKIAQLTKVIFHLNTRNEDFQMEFQYLKRLHAQEVATVTNDAKHKLLSVQEQLTATTQSLQNYEKEKHQWLKDAASFQQKALAKQQAIETAFEQKMTSLTEQVETTKQQFRERLSQLSQVASSSQQDQVETLRRQHDAMVQDLKAAHAEEIAAMVQQANAKYNQMLAEQLRQQDALRDQQIAKERWYEANLTAQANELDDIWQKRLKNDQNDHRQAMESMKTQLVSKMEALLRDMEALRLNETTLRLEKEQLIETTNTWERQCQALELQVTKATNESVSIKKDADAGVLTLQSALTQSNEKITQLASELDALTAKMQQKDATIRQLTTQIDQLQLELVHSNAKTTESEKFMQQKVAERELEIANLQMQLKAVQQASSQTESQWQLQLDGLNAQIRVKDQEIQALTQQLSAMGLKLTQLETTNRQFMDQMQSDRQKAEADRLQLEAKIVTTTQLHETQRQEMAKAHQMALESQNTTFSTQMAALEAQLKQQTTQSLEQTAQMHQNALEKLQKEADKQLLALKTQLEAQQTAKEQQFAKQLAEKDQEIEKCKAQITNLTQQLQKLTTERENMVKSSQQTQKEREEAYQKQLKDLQNQKENVLKRIDGEKEKIHSDWRDKVKQLIGDHQAQLAKAQLQYKNDLKTQLASANTTLTDQYERQLTQVKDEMEELHRDLEETKRQAMETQREAMEARALDHQDAEGRLYAIVLQLQAAANDQMKQFQNQLSQLREDHAQELRIQHEKAEQERQRMEISAKQELERLQTQLSDQHTAQTNELKQQHALALTKQAETLETRRSCDLLALQTEMTSKLRDFKLQKETEHAAILQKTTLEHETQVGLLQKQLQSTQQTLQQTTSELKASRQETQRLESELTATIRQMNEAISQLEKSHREQIETLKQASKQQMDRLLEENLHETKQLSDQFEETKRLMTEKVAFLKQTISDWEVKYAQRDSRPEDLSRIADLERLVLEKEALVRQTLDEMAYFKRELLNREEMYNKTFARTPNVGILQVLKPHVQLQQQLQAQNPLGPAPQQKRKTKPLADHTLERRHSERNGGSSGTPVKKSLPPLNPTANSNQFSL